VDESDTVVVVAPVPVSAMDWGEPVAVSMMVMFALNAPTAVGSKCPWMVQLAAGARLTPHVFPNANEEAFVPVTAMLLMPSVQEPVLVRVTLCELVATPTISPPKDKLVDESDTVVAPSPVPVSAMVCGEFVALSVMVIAAVIAPIDVG